ncbi:hypothetical protein SAMN04487897_110113 [Paenibacillus sp. yr247]|uniref:hypothetical protein n=1 Tax=Paenibacillus sp. yr247 TaxID=1761880 RepID=UPI000886EA21|nr:hypothetical protein [Paenibacillus sp. yr247]SDO24720.1 hypothetical protein SAMN04487897_110113 [Paenibacillus sp. yr247]
MEDKLVAIQVGAVSFVDEGVENVLDTLQELGSVNTVFLANYTYTRDTGGRQTPGFPIPDHGTQEYDLNFIGGNNGIAHAEYYRRTFVKPEDFRAKEHGDTDIMAAVIPAAHRKGMKVYAWIEESSGRGQGKWIPNYVNFLEQDFKGRRGKRPCFNHPDYRNWHFGLVEDYIKSYEIDGVAWCSERQGPLGNMFGGPWATGEVTCFCSHCRKLAEERSIDVEHARQGYTLLHDLFSQARENIRPNDGYFVSFWRLLLQYPEILAWEALWHEGQKKFFRELYGMVKAINPAIQVGWHIFHLNSFSPFYRATQDLEEMSHYSDFIKLVAYNNCAGPRFLDFMQNIHNTIFHDALPDESLELMYRFLGIDEGTLGEIPQKGWSAEYVRRETLRALGAVKKADNETRIYPGIDVDIPTGEGLKQTEPEDVYQAVTAAFEAGAHGIVLSRKYSEMKLVNLAACGKAIKDLNDRNI